jgi:predicted transposase/invertase (TIGR01784 family)
MLVKEHPEVEGAVGKLKRMSLWDQVRMVMDEREIRRKDMMAIQDGLREEGFEKGLEEGTNRTRREEREQSHQEKIEAARNLLVHGVSPELIAGSLKLPPEEIAAL